VGSGCLFKINQKCEGDFKRNRKKKRKERKEKCPPTKRNTVTGAPDIHSLDRKIVAQTIQLKEFMMAVKKNFFSYIAKTPQCCIGVLYGF